MNETLKSVLIAVLVLALVLFGVTESKIEFANGVVKLLLIIVVFYGLFAVTYFVGTYPFKGLPQKLTESDNGFLKSLGYIIWALLGIGVLFLFIFVSSAMKKPRSIAPISFCQRPTGHLGQAGCGAIPKK